MHYTAEQLRRAREEARAQYKLEHYRGKGHNKFPHNKFNFNRKRGR